MQQLIRYLSEIRPDVDFLSNIDLIESGILSSVDIIQIVSLIEERYNKSVPARELLPENFSSAKAIFAMIERL